jgi:hypothetical protein
MQCGFYGGIGPRANEGRLELSPSTKYVFWDAWLSRFGMLRFFFGRKCLSAVGYDTQCIRAISGFIFFRFFCVLGVGSLLKGVNLPRGYEVEIQGVTRGLFYICKVVLSEN